MSFRKTIAIAVFLMVSPVGCAGQMMAANPLLGSWRNTSTVNSVMITDTYAFEGSNQITFTHVMVTPNDASLAAAGCTSTSRYTGTFTSTATMMTPTFTAGTSETTGCTDTSLNSASHAATTDEVMLLNMAQSYTITGTMLMMGGTTFTKQ